MLILLDGVDDLLPFRVQIPAAAELANLVASYFDMQGFNKYYPPDYDGEKHGSLNSYRGKHALGDRARKIDQGILITRFELPFNIWCGTCNNHIGMGVRYNAEKKKIGSYYSTPIFSFRCKCHLCDGWFEIQTDPQNIRYVVTSGARRKEEDWDPEDNGGYAVHDTDPSKPPLDALAALEKSTAAETHQTAVVQLRIESLQFLSEHYNSDPYSLSLKVRKRFRAEKKIEKEKKRLEDEVKGRYALPEELRLVEDGEEELKEARLEWEKGRREVTDRKKRKLGGEGLSIGKPSSILKPASSSKSKGVTSNLDAVSALRARLLRNPTRQPAH